MNTYGEAERAIYTVKDILRKCCDPHLALTNLYQATPIHGRQYSPAELLMGHVLRTTVPTMRKLWAPWTYLLQMKSDLGIRWQRRNKRRNFDDHHGARELPKVRPGDRVWIPEKETEAIVQEEVAPHFLLITTDQGSELRQNRQDMHDQASPVIWKRNNNSFCMWKEIVTHLKFQNQTLRRHPHLRYQDKINMHMKGLSLARWSKHVPVPTNYTTLHNMNHWLFR